MQLLHATWFEVRNLKTTRGDAPPASIAGLHQSQQPGTGRPKKS
jgi:hypothetical protein